MCFWNKKITLLGVIKSENPDKILTIVTTKNDAVEFARKLVIFNHIDHYSRWCELKNIQALSTEVEQEYLDTCVGAEELDSYKIVKLDYTKEHLATILRVNLGAIPLGCSFETDEEVQLFLDSIPDNEIVDATKDETEEKDKTEE